MFLTLLPSGSILGLNVKMIAFVPVSFFAFKISLRRGYVTLAINIGVVLVISAWLILSQFYAMFPFTLALTQYKDVITTLAGCWFVRMYTLEEEDRKTFIRLCVYTVAAGGFLKVLLFSYSMVTGVSTTSLIDGISKIFGVQLMTADLGELFGRIQFVSDTLVPICIFAILCLRFKLNISAWKSFIIFDLMIISSLFTFSRFLWGNTILAIVLGMIVAKKDRLHLLYIGVASAAAIYFFELIEAVVEVRFSDTFVDASDIDRKMQNLALNNFFWEAPVFGHGLGSFSTVLIRSQELPYSYESQVLALCGQVGVVGIALFAGLLLNYYRKAFSFKRGVRMYQMSVLIILGAFIASGFFNPYLLSSTAAVSFGLIFALAQTA